MKSIKYFWATVVIMFVVPLMVGATDTPATYTSLVSLPGVSTAGASVNVPNYISGILTLVISLSGALAVLMLVIGGTQYVASGITPDQKQRAKERIRDALIGLALVLGSWLILHSINPNLNKSTLPALDHVGEQESETSYREQQLLDAQYKQMAEERITFEKTVLSQLKPSASEVAVNGDKPYSSPISDDECMTQPFGYTSYAASVSMYGNDHFHDGIDIRADNQPVHAIHSGKVVASGSCMRQDAEGNMVTSDYGNWIYIVHDGDAVPDASLYAHLSSKNVNVGDTVTAGETIATSGDSGVPGRPHLHISLMNTTAVAPGGSAHCGSDFPMGAYPDTYNPAESSPQPIPTDYQTKGAYLDLEKSLKATPTMCIDNATGEPYAR